MKLYDVYRGSVIRVLGDIQTPPGSPEIREYDILYFDHLDGMYSVCLKHEDVVHLAAWTEVEVYIDPLMKEYYQNIIKRKENQVL